MMLWLDVLFCQMLDNFYILIVIGSKWVQHLLELFPRKVRERVVAHRERMLGVRIALLNLLICSNKVLFSIVKFLIVSIVLSFDDCILDESNSLLVPDSVALRFCLSLGEFQQVLRDLKRIGALCCHERR